MFFHCGSRYSQDPVTHPTRTFLAELSPTGKISHHVNVNEKSTLENHLVLNSHFLLDAEEWNVNQDE